MMQMQLNILNIEIVISLAFECFLIIKGTVYPNK